VFQNIQRTLKRFNLQRAYKRFNMQRVYKRFSIAIGFLMLLILLITNTIITQHLLDVQTNDQAWVAHTQQVLTQVDQIRSLMTNAETGQRAYITTDDPNYLVPYDLAVTQLQPNVQQLAELTKDTPEEQARIVNLRSLAQTKMDMLSTNILLFQSGNRDMAREMAVSERGRLLTVKINNLLNELAQEQSSLKGSWSATYQSSVGRTIASIYFDSIVVAIGLIFLGYYILREVNRRDRRARVRLAREKWFRSALTSLGDAVIATDKRGLVTFLNPKAELLMGMQLLQAKGQPVEKVFPLFDEATLEPIENSVTKVIEQGDPVDLRSEAFLKSSNGLLIPIKDSATLIRDSRDQPLGAVLVFRDATFERQTHKLLRTTDGLTVSAELLATASRQIDAPLVAAGDMIYIAKLSEGVPTDASDLLTLAEGYLGRASYIAREVLGFYREFAPPEQVDLSALVDSVLRSFSNKIHSKNIAIERDYHNCPPVSGLSGELNQAVTHLVSNAVDAVPLRGTIRAQLSCHDNADRRVIMLSIRDNGPGISLANRDRLFEPFFTTKEGTGYGLGLWTTKRIVERHGGSIQVKYEDGDPSTGTVFNVFLPVNTNSDPPYSKVDRATGG
jgi:PAS domain S-box-containing protein